eukprot:3277519-Karenia_brevis.AAC.1
MASCPLTPTESETPEEPVTPTVVLSDQSDDDEHVRKLAEEVAKETPEGMLRKLKEPAFKDADVGKNASLCTTAGQAEPTTHAEARRYTDKEFNT